MKVEKIHNDEVDWLISIYNSSFDEELKKESYEKLISFGLSDTEIKEKCKILHSGEDDQKHFEKAWKIQKERNRNEEYTLFEKIKIFFFGPYELFKYFDCGLKELFDLNYKTKLRQRLILLISGTIFWILFFVGTYKYYEFKRMQEIEKADISDWEKNRIQKK